MPAIDPELQPIVDHAIDALCAAIDGSGLDVATILSAEVDPYGWDSVVVMLSGIRVHLVADHASPPDDRAWYYCEDPIHGRDATTLDHLPIWLLARFADQTAQLHDLQDDYNDIARRASAADDRPHIELLTIQQIRDVLGDPHGRLMLTDLVDRIRELVAAEYHLATADQKAAHGCTNQPCQECDR
jgi:hypothetical protein